MKRNIGEFSRRVLLKSAAPLGLLPALPLVGCAGAPPPSWWQSKSGTFQHGVASGDPLVDRVILWTRVSGFSDSDVAVEWEIAGEPTFAGHVSRGHVVARAASDYTVKIDATGLQPGTSYYYRFFVEGEASPVGRTKTLPGPAASEARLAAVSCSNFPAGYFHVYEEIAHEELDAVLHLGDYLYEYSAAGYATDDAEKLGRIPEPAAEALTLDDYRTRHAQYRRDVSLQACHARHPFIVVWDDHELANNSFHDGAQNHSAAEGDFWDRRAAAMQAWFEWMPIRAPSSESDVIYRAFEFGSLAQLLMIDTRHRGRDQQLSLADYRLASTEDVVSMNDDAAAEQRTMLGQEQKEWLIDKLQNSRHRWQVLGQQVLMGRYNVPALMVESIERSGSSNFPKGVEVGKQAIVAMGKDESERTPEECALLESFVPFNLDSWDGYAAERDEILRVVAAAGKSLVVVAGDTHNAWSSALRTKEGQVVGAEFGTASVTSPGYEENHDLESLEILEDLMVGVVSDLEWTDLKSRGFVVLEIGQSEVVARFGFVSGVKERSYERLASHKMTLSGELALRSG